MHERTLVPFLVSPVEFWRRISVSIFSILLLQCSVHSQRREYELLDFFVAATVGTVSVSSLCLLNFETSPVIYPVLQVDF